MDVVPKKRKSRWDNHWSNRKFWPYKALPRPTRKVNGRITKPNGTDLNTHKINQWCRANLGRWAEGWHYHKRTYYFKTDEARFLFSLIWS